MARVLLINGSPHKEGCVYTALLEVAGVLEARGIESLIFHIGTSPVRGCVACGRCSELGRCVFDDDICNRMLEEMKKADGLVIGTPVYYAGANGTLCALLDRAFFAARGKMAYKPGAAVVSCRRGGASASFDRINKYFTINSMPVVSSQYWNSVHGMTPDDVRQDLEGLQTMRVLGENMAWMLLNTEKAALPYPVPETPIRTNFVR